MKIQKNAFTALFPCPVVLVSCVDSDGKPNIITLAWAGTVCSEPPMVGVSIRPTRYSYQLIKDIQEFVVNIPSLKFIQETDYCGVASGRDVEKFSETKFTPEKAYNVQVPMIQECPVNLECVLKDIIPLGAHDLFLGEVVQVHIDENVLDEKGKIDFKKADPFVFNVGEYWNLNKKVGTYGFSKRS
ncbi:MAG: flavin reductase family protein [Candidatus Bathyarchaeota archaeon]|nr:MAG: flavin reductase family protein [Candidatus Bathyarchaeum tardum]WNZ28757.1 MAG: flavin reductase family protein [Candidatus Bathyarchaeota archaeon]